MKLQDKINRQILEYAKSNLTEVLHTTLNPDGPGVVRIHMVPPAINEDSVNPGIVIINGQDIIPINPSWMILLAEFINAVNKYSGKELDEADTRQIIKDTVSSVRKIYKFLPKKIIKNDLIVIMDSFTSIARGELPDETIGYMSIGEYAPNMKAPHRMDLLISSMMCEGKWHCNQKCIHCYAAGQELSEEQELDTNTWKAIIDKCRECGIPQITFTGGEPTMRDDLVELIEHSKWFVTRLNTNGIKLSKDLCQKLREASLDSMQITFYSANEEIHNKLVGADQYTNTLAGIENALEENLNISINTPLCTLNKDYVDTLRFLHDKGVRYVTCSGLITTGNATGEESLSLQLSTEEIKTILKEATEYCFSNGMEISFTSPGWIEKEFFGEIGINEPECGACLSNMAITPGGNVVPCQSYLSGENMGNMLDKNWEDIWNSPMCMERRNFSADMNGTCPLRRVK